MMTAKQLNEAHGLTTRIGATMRLVAEYTAAGDVIVSLPAESSQGFCRTKHEVKLQNVEIGDVIVSALRARVETMKTQLRDLGVEWKDEAEESAR